MSRPRQSRQLQMPGAPEVVAEPDPAESPADHEYQAPRTGRFVDLRADEVDATTLSAPVLTKDGWVCPATKAKD